VRSVGRAARAFLGRACELVCAVVCGAFVVVFILFEIYLCTGLAAGLLYGLRVPHGGVIAVAVVPLVVVLVNVEDVILEPRRARRPRVQRAEDAIARGRATLVHYDDFGRLWDARTDTSVDPIRVVEVVNATPDEHGSSRRYFLRVPPNVPTAHEAVAWTFGLGAAEYVPARES
jgi:hypothetical protein